MHFFKWYTFFELNALMILYIFYKQLNVVIMSCYEFYRNSWIIYVCASIDVFAKVMQLNVLIACSQKVMHWSLNHFCWQYYCYFCWFFSKLIPFLFLVSIVTCIIKQCFIRNHLCYIFAVNVLVQLHVKICFLFFLWRFLFVEYCIFAAICLRCRTFSSYQTGSTWFKL